MTKQQILDTLETLKEFTNASGKQTIDGVKAGIHSLHEQPPYTPVPVVPPTPKPEEPKQKTFKPLNVKKPKGARK